MQGDVRDAANSTSGNGGETGAPRDGGESQSTSGLITTDAGASESTSSAGDAGGVPSDAAACTILPNTGSATDGDANIDLKQKFQRIAGFGGMDGGFYAELTASQVDAVFGNGPGQLGLSILRMRVKTKRASCLRCRCCIIGMRRRRGSNGPEGGDGEAMAPVAHSVAPLRKVTAAFVFATREEAVAFALAMVVSSAFAPRDTIRFTSLARQARKPLA